jgi:hypothetical protein
MAATILVPAVPADEEQLLSESGVWTPFGLQEGTSVRQKSP